MRVSVGVRVALSTHYPLIFILITPDVFGTNDKTHIISPRMEGVGSITFIRPFPLGIFISSRTATVSTIAPTIIYSSFVVVTEISQTAPTSRPHMHPLPPPIARHNTLFSGRRRSHIYITHPQPQPPFPNHPRQKS